VECADEINDAGNLAGVFKGTNKHQDWKNTVEVVLVRPTLSLRRINRNDSSRRSEDPEVAPEPKSESEFRKLRRAYKRDDVGLA